jgi:very-short-patch-repair endonuclease
VAAARDVEAILREFGASQHGVVARAQLLAQGLRPSAIDRMLRSGRLETLHRGVYRIGPRPAPRSAEMAALLRCGAGSRLSHASAACLHGLVAGSARRPVEVTVPRERRPRAAGVILHRVTDPHPEEVTVVDGIAVTTPARTLLDIGATMTERQVEQALATALRLGLVTLARMRRLIDRQPRHPGAPMLRRLLALEGGPAFTRSEAEEKLLRIIRLAGLPQPELNVAVLGHEVDFLWRDARVVAEVDGYASHGSRRPFTADRRRDAALTAAGYRVLRFTWADVTDGALATVARLAQVLAI